MVSTESVEMVFCFYGVVSAPVMLACNKLKPIAQNDSLPFPMRDHDNP